MMLLPRSYLSLFVTLLAVLLLSGCMETSFDLGNKNLLKMTPFRMGTYAKDAPPMYKEGWTDGCETGLSTMVQGGYKSLYTYKFKPELADDQNYYKAWKDSYTYCRQYSFRWSWEPFDRNYHKALNNPLCVLCPNELGRAQ